MIRNKTLGLVALTLVFAGLLAACTPKPAPAPAPEAPVAEAPAPAQPALDPAAWAALTGPLKAGLEAHDWDSVLNLCDPDHREAQLGGLGMSNAQYLAEILGVHSVDNDISRGAEAVKDEHLLAIKSVSFGEPVADDAGGFRTDGVLTLADGSTLSLHLSIKLVGTSYVLTGAAG